MLLGKEANEGVEPHREEAVSHQIDEGNGHELNECVCVLVKEDGSTEENHNGSTHLPSFK